MNYKLVIVGCGNMGEAIASGILAAGKFQKSEIAVTHPRAERREFLQERLGVAVYESNLDPCKNAEIILLGVKPQVIKQALRDMQGHLNPNQLVISIAAGISLRHIESYLLDIPSLRAMPNLPVTVRKGVTAIAPGIYATEKHLERAQELFECVGIVERVAEQHMDAVTGLSGTGPMYVVHILEALADAGVNAGLPRAVANRLALETLRGSIELVDSMAVHPAEIKDLVSSPGGTSMAALQVLRREAFQAILVDAVSAATARSKQLGES